MISLYLSGRSWLHGIPAGVKLLALVAITLVIVPLADPNPPVISFSDN